MAKIGKEGVVGSDITEGSQQERGREEQPTPRPQRGKSRDILASMEERIQRVENGINSVDVRFEGIDQRVDGVDERLDGLEEESSELSSAIKERMTRLEDSYKEDLGRLEAEMGRMRGAYERELQLVLQQLEQVMADLAVCKRAFVTGPAQQPVLAEARRVDVPKPKSFAGSRNAREVDNFLWGLDQYFGASGIVEEATKVQTAALYLTDTAMLWWRRRQEDVRRGTCTIATFDEFKAELKRQFYPENAEDEARGRLRRLKQTGTIRDYVKDFTSLVLEIPDMSDKDSLFYFMDGLQAWAKTELRRRGVQDLASAIAAAESLIDYSSKDSNKSKEKKSGPTKGGGAHTQAPRKESSGSQGSSKPKDDKSKSKRDKSGSASNVKCFLCDGPHYIKDCPARRAISAMTVTPNPPQAEGNKDDGNSGAHMGSLQLLNVIQAAPKVQAKG